MATKAGSVFDVVVTVVVITDVVLFSFPNTMVFNSLFHVFSDKQNAFK